jgi:hypothetical protein
MGALRIRCGERPCEAMGGGPTVGRCSRGRSTFRRRWSSMPLGAGWCSLSTTSSTRPWGSVALSPYGPQTGREAPSGAPRTDVSRWRTAAALGSAAATLVACQLPVRSVDMGGARPRYQHRGSVRPVQQPHESTGFEPLQHTMWTFEGQVEQMGRFAQRLNDTSGWRRVVGKALFTLPLWLMLGGCVVAAVIGALRWIF